MPAPEMAMATLDRGSPRRWAFIPMAIPTPPRIGGRKRIANSPSVMEIFEK
jgi:hypothetical protein